MCPKMGRPKIENPKATLVGVRLDGETVKKLDEVTEARKTTRSEVIREGIEKVYSDMKK